MQPIYYVRGDCCHSTIIKFRLNFNDIRDTCKKFGAKGLTRSKDCVIRHVCGDGEQLQGDNYFCGIRSCNIFGCNCSGGCIPGNPELKFETKHRGKITIIH